MNRATLAVLISGRGSNLAAILDSPLRARVSLVASDNPRAAGLQVAAARGAAAKVVDRALYNLRGDFEGALAAAVDDAAPRFIALAGFMRVLSPNFVARYAGRLINIHPSLLPAYRGLHTHARALAAGETRHGCSVHYVNEEVDGGDIIAQSAVAVLPDDDEQTLAARTLAAEHFLYPAALRTLLENAEAGHCRK